MHNLRGKNIIQALQRKWMLRVQVICLAFAFSTTAMVSAFVIKFFHVSWLNVPVIFVLSFAIIYSIVHRKISETDVVNFLNRTFPELQESSGLILKPYSDLNSLEKFQLERVQGSLKDDIRMPVVLSKKSRGAGLSLLAALSVCVLVAFVPVRLTSYQTGRSMAANEKATVRPETRLAQVQSVSIKVTPPAYTGKATKEQDRFNITAEEGAYVTWTINTSKPVKGLQLVFNDKSVMQLQIGNADKKWMGKKMITRPGFYQVNIDGNLSELYRIEMIKDQPPVIIVQSPKPNTLVEYGLPPRLVASISLTDDYGIKNSFISATIATGSGEAVKFKEQQLQFSNFSGGNKYYRLQKQLDLAALGMQPGDELYFYIIARDTHNQEKRSDVYIVTLEDTAQLMSAEGLVMGVDLKPEFFRSQRQIIIETEQLLHDKTTISAEDFAKKSSDLGADQKLLRLRYGKFLGEENETEIGTDHDHEGQGQGDQNDAVFGNADKLMEQYTHKHDIAEDASFFDANTKKQLLATLSEMWKAELQLRTIKPKDALPFEYKALRLLKDLQQQSRVYVAKTGLKTTPLKTDKRLTGDLSKIIAPITQRDIKQQNDPAMIIRKALGVLEQVRNKEPVLLPAKQVLEEAAAELSKSAAAQPSVYLSSLEALRRIITSKFRLKDVDVAGSGLQQIVKRSSNLPQKSTTTTGMKISKLYFRHLNRRND